MEYVRYSVGKLRLYAFYNGQFIMLLAFSSNVSWPSCYYIFS